jgi:hypothetical protein
MAIELFAQLWEVQISYSSEVHCLLLFLMPTAVSIKKLRFLHPTAASPCAPPQMAHAQPRGALGSRRLISRCSSQPQTLSSIAHRWDWSPYFSLRDEDSFQFSAFSGTCLRDQYDRPIAGALNICPSSVPATVMSGSVRGLLNPYLAVRQTQKND